MPLDMPVCGYNGRLCDYSRIFAGLAVVCVLLVLGPIFYLLYIKQ